MADFAAYQEMQGLSAADFEAHAQAEVMAEFAAYQESQGPSAADFAAFQQSQTPLQDPGATLGCPLDRK